MTFESIETMAEIYTDTEKLEKLNRSIKNVADSYSGISEVNTFKKFNDMTEKREEIIFGLDFISFYSKDANDMDKKYIADAIDKSNESFKKSALLLYAKIDKGKLLKEKSMLGDLYMIEDVLEKIV